VIFAQIRDPFSRGGTYRISLSPCTLPAIGLTPSAKLRGPHPIDPLGDHDLSMLAIANIAAEDAGAVLPEHRFTGSPNRAYRGRPRPRAQLVALACLPRLASG